MSELGIIGNNLKLQSDAKALRRKAQSIGGKLQSIAEGIASKYGARVTPINYKSVDSIVRKAKGERNGIKDIKDSYRTTIIASKDSISKIIKDLKGKHRDFEFIRHKEQKLNTGYTGNIINVRNKRTGLIGEIQVNTAKMIYAKENFSVAYKLLGGATMRQIYKETKKPSGWGHALYEQSRTAKRNGGKNQRSVSMQQAYYATFQ